MYTPHFPCRPTSTAHLRRNTSPLLRVLSLGILLASLSGCSLLMGGSDELEENPPDVAQALADTPRLEVDGRASLNFKSVRRHRLPDPPLQVTREVKREIRSLLRGNANCIRVATERRQPHLATIQEIFDDEGIPRDMMNLAVIESRFSSEARSRSGALGIWQFTRGTAKLYGLRMDGKVDQRKDPILSTLAAARLLRDLYGRYGDWYLALAAYNAGPGVVDRAVSRSANDSFWALARGSYFSRQTKDFIPRFIAATILMKTAERHGIDNLEYSVRSYLAKQGISFDVDSGSSTALLQEGLYADIATDSVG